MMIRCAVVLAVGLLATSAAADPLPPLTAKDVFLTSHTPQPFPARARQRGLSAGGAEVQCLIGADLRLTDCKAVDEAPMGGGFGQAAVRVFSGAEVAALAKDGTSTALRTVTLHMRFSLGESDPNPGWPPY